MTQYARPESDIVQGNWSANGEDMLWQCVDDITSDNDSTNIQENGSNHCEIGLSSIEVPAAGTVSVISWSRHTGAGSNPTCTFTLREGLSTTIASWTHSSIGGSYSSRQYDLSTAERDSITDWGDLRIRCDRTAGVADIMITQIYLSAPDPAATAVAPSNLSHSHTSENPTVTEAVGDIDVYIEDSSHSHFVSSPFAREEEDGHQYAYTIADLVHGDWSPNTGFSLYQTLNDAHDAAAPNSDYVFCGGADHCEMRLTPLGVPGTGATTIYWRGRQEGVLSQFVGKGYLFQETTQIASWTITPTGVWSLQSYTLTSEQQGKITKWCSLRVRLDWYSGGNVGMISQLYLEAPKAVTALCILIKDNAHTHTGHNAHITQNHSINISSAAHTSSAEDMQPWEGTNLYIKSDVIRQRALNAPLTHTHIMVAPQ